MLCVDGIVNRGSATVPSSGVNSVVADYYKPGTTPTALVAVNDKSLSTTTLGADKAAVGCDVALEINLTSALPNNGTKKVEVTVVGTSGKEYAASAPVLVEPARTVATCEFEMPDEDVTITAAVVDTNPDITVTPHLVGTPTIDYSINTSPATTGRVADGTGVTAKKDNVITFTSDDNFFVGVGNGDSNVTTVTPAVEVNGKYTYTYTIDAAAHLTLYKAVTVTVINQTNGNVALTWNAAKMNQGGTLNSNTATIDVPSGCAWMGFTDPSNVMQLTVTDGTNTDNGANHSVKYDTAISGAVNLTVSALA